MLTAGRERGKVAAHGARRHARRPAATRSCSSSRSTCCRRCRSTMRSAQEKIALQEKINTAVIKGTGWADIPAGGAARRRHAVVLQLPDLQSREGDGRHAPAGGDRAGRARYAGACRITPTSSAEMARERKGDKVPVEVVKVPGVNHLLVPAKTGDVSEYASLGPDAKVSPQVTSAIATFLTKVLKELSAERAADPHHRPRPAGADARAHLDSRALRRARPRRRPGRHSRRPGARHPDRDDRVAAIVGDPDRSAARGAPARRRGEVLGVELRRVRRVGRRAGAAAIHHHAARSRDHGRAHRAGVGRDVGERASTSIASTACRRARRSSRDASLAALLRRVHRDRGGADRGRTRIACAPRWRAITESGDVDVAFQHDSIFRRNRRLVAFDMDSTLIQGEVIDELARLAGRRRRGRGRSPKARCAASSISSNRSAAASRC